MSYTARHVEDFIFQVLTIAIMELYNFWIVEVLVFWFLMFFKSSILLFSVPASFVSWFINLFKIKVHDFKKMLWDRVISFGKVYKYSSISYFFQFFLISHLKHKIILILPHVINIAELPILFKCIKHSVRKYVVTFPSAFRW